MSLTRKMLKAMGIDDEKVDQIIEAHSETVEGLKSDIAKYKADSEALPKVKEDLDKAKADLEAVGKDSWKVKYETVKKEFEVYKGEQAKKETHAAKETAYRALLKQAGIREKHLESVLKVSDVDSLDLDDNGAVKDADKRLSDIKSEFADFIGTTSTQGAQTATPPANTSGQNMTKSDIYKKDDHGRYILSSAERQKALMENQII